MGIKFRSDAAQAGFKSVQISAVKIRADGSVVDLGTIAQWHRNPFIRAWRTIKARISR